MSRNLHLTEGEDGREVNLWQTPNHITDMCLSYDENGHPDGGMSGVMRRYQFWILSKTDGVWRSKEDLNEMRESVKAHLEEIRAVKEPFFWGM